MIIHRSSSFTFEYVNIKHFIYSVPYFYSLGYFQRLFFLFFFCYLFFNAAMNILIYVSLCVRISLRCT